MDSALLERLAETEYDESPREWDQLLQNLNLPRTYQPAMAIALRQGRWKDANKPLAYLHRVAKVEARKLLFDCGTTLANDPPSKTPLALDRVVKAEYANKAGEAVNKDEAVDNKAHKVMEREGFYDRSEAYYVEEKLPRGFRAVSEEEREEGVPIADWDAIAKDVGLDDEETELLKLRAWGVKRNQPGRPDADNRAIETVWKRLSRKMPLIRKRLESLKEKDGFNLGP